jgi:hypothetical protein
MSDFSYFQPQSHSQRRDAYVENAGRSERYLNDSAIQREQGGGDPLFWDWVAGLLPGRPGKPIAPRSYMPRQLPIDTQFDAVRRRDQRQEALNRPPTPSEAIAAEVADVVTTAVNKVAKISKLEQAMTWLREALNSGPQTEKAIQAMARKASINARTLKRAKQALRVQSIRKGRQSWIWALTRAGQEGDQSR